MDIGTQFQVSGRQMGVTLKSQLLEKLSAPVTISQISQSCWYIIVLIYSWVEVAEL